RLTGEFDTTRQPVTPSDAVRNALATRPDLFAARPAEKLASAQIEQARTEGKVDASIFAGYERMSSGFDVFGFSEAGARVPVMGVFHNLTFGVRLSLPVRNRNEGNVEAALSSAEAARNLDVIRQTYTLGQKTALDYISEQRRFIEVETGYTEVLKEYFNSFVE